MILQTVVSILYVLPCNVIRFSCSSILIWCQNRCHSILIPLCFYPSRVFKILDQTIPLFLWVRPNDPKRKIRSSSKINSVSIFVQNFFEQCKTSELSIKRKQTVSFTFLLDPDFFLCLDSSIDEGGSSVRQNYITIITYSHQLNRILIVGLKEFHGTILITVNKSLQSNNNLWYKPSVVCNENRINHVTRGKQNLIKFDRQILPISGGY